ncbi:MAG: hypothetical protein ACYSWU_23625 [Planctomycetota bacterium]
MKLSLWRKLVYTAVLLVFALLCLEVLMRCCGLSPEPAAQTPPRPTGGEPKVSPLAYFAVCDPHLGIRNRPNGSYHTWFIEGEPLVTTDEFGYRNGYGWPGDGESPIVLFVGDSVIFCAEVNDQQTAPSEVAKLLSQEFDVRVINTGVRSYNTVQAKRTLIECFERFPSIKVAVYTYCGNDIEENIVPNIRYPFKTPYLAHDEATGRFREVEVTDPAIPSGKLFYGWTPPPRVLSRRERVTQWLEDRSALLNRCLAGIRRLDSGRVGPHRFPDGKAIVPPCDYGKWHIWAAENGGRQALRQLLAEMDQICRNHGAAFLATCSVNGHDFASSRAFAVDCAEAGVRFVSLEEQFTDNPAVYTCVRVDGQYDEHYGPVGTKTYAKALAPALKQILRSQASASVPDVEIAADD